MNEPHPMVSNDSGSCSSQMNPQSLKAPSQYEVYPPTRPRVFNVEGSLRTPLRFVQERNAAKSISVTPSGIISEPVSPLQSANALFPIFSSLSGRIRLVMLRLL